MFNLQHTYPAESAGLDEVYGSTIRL